MSQVKITDVDTLSKGDTFSATVRLDNGDSYQLRVVTDAYNVYSWIDYRKNSKWSQLVEIRDGLISTIRGKTYTNS